MYIFPEQWSEKRVPSLFMHGYYMCMFKFDGVILKGRQVPYLVHTIVIVYFQVDDWLNLLFQYK